MGKTFTVIKHEFRQTIKRKAFIIITISLPLLLMLGYGVYEGVQQWYEPGKPEAINIGYVDNTGDFNEHTTQGDVIFIYYDNDEEAKSALLKDEIRELIHANLILVCYY